MSYRMQLVDTAPDTTVFDIRAYSTTAVNLGGLYYGFNLAGADFPAATAELTAGDGAVTTISLGVPPPSGNTYAQSTVKALRIRSSARQRSLEILFQSATPITLTRQARQNGRAGAAPAAADAADTTISIEFPIGTGRLATDRQYQLTFTVKAGVDADTAPVTVSVDAARPGPAFLGVGGNFRLQSNADAAYIDYNLANLRITWARLAMPLDLWQTSATMNPIAAAEDGQLDARVRQSMELARTLAEKNIPMIISDWAAPAWAVDQAPAAPRAEGGGTTGRRIADAQWPAMYKAIGSYLIYLKKNYHAEPELFSFNEADLGIDVHLTPEDHARVIRELGACLAGQGLKTRMLLGDTASPTPRPGTFLDPTLADPEAMKYVGAVAYHSWNGGSDAQLAFWGRTAQRLKLPLFVSEGGTDPDAYRFPNLLREPWYARDEMALYLRCCRLSAPAAILPWQLTADYSLLARGPGAAGVLQPTQRFFDLRQLNLTPAGAPWLPITVDRPHIVAAAFGDAAHGYAIHLLNDGATRSVTLTGLPAGLARLRVHTTDSTRHMQESGPIPVNNGSARLTLDARSYVTLTGP